MPRRLLLVDYLHINCTKLRVHLESNRLGCIAAVTMNAFRNFHDTLSTVLHNIRYSSSPSCINKLMLTWGSTPDHSGYPVLTHIANEIIRRGDDKLPVLARWCDRFAPVTQLNLAVVEKRFTCCVAASGLFLVKKAFIEKFDPALVRVHCDQLLQLEWVDDLILRRKMRDICIKSSIIMPAFAETERIPLESACLS